MNQLNIDNMKRISIFLLGLICLSGTAFAQEIKEDFVPSVMNQPGQEYPMVNSQGYARFRIYAPEAQSVIVSLGLGGQGGTVLTKDAGYNAVSYISEGTAHEFQAWRRSLKEMAPLLFR